jgi:GNAT superfamily N-acetyltransferase
MAAEIIGGSDVSCQTRLVDLRRATVGDELEVARVHVRSWQVGYRGLLPGSYLDELRPEDRAARYTFGGGLPHGPYTVVAVVDGAIRGFASVSVDGSDRDAGELLALYVDPAWWRRGVGRALIREGRSLLAERGFDAAILWLLVGNGRGERFYRADGWGPDGARRQDEVWGITVDEMRFARRLP